MDIGQYTVRLISAALFMNIQLVQTIPVCVPTMQVCEGGLQQLGEAGSPRLSRGGVLALEVWRLLVLQLQLCQLQHQGLAPHCPLGRRSTLWERPQVRYGEAKDKDSMGGEEGERGAQLHALGLREKKSEKSFSIDFSILSENRF